MTNFKDILENLPDDKDLKLRIFKFKVLYQGSILELATAARTENGALEKMKMYNVLEIL